MLQRCGFQWFFRKTRNWHGRGVAGKCTDFWSFMHNVCFCNKRINNNNNDLVNNNISAFIVIMHHLKTRVLFECFQFRELALYKLTMATDCLPLFALSFSRWRSFPNISTFTSSQSNDRTNPRARSSCHNERPSLRTFPTLVLPRPVGRQRIHLPHTWLLHILIMFAGQNLL